MDTYISIQTWILIVALFVGGLVFTLAFRAYNLNVKRIVKTLAVSNKKTKRGISGLQTLMLSTASRIGNGNVAGVAGAIVVGGPGALFWMWVTALFGMATAFAEGALSQAFKRKQGDTYIGGTPFYIAAKKNAGRLVKTVASIYAIVALVTFATAYIGVQSNTIAGNFSNVMTSHLDIDPIIYKLIAGFLLAGVMLFVTIRGVKSIGKFSLIVMPTMGAIYLVVALVIIFINIEMFGTVWGWIFENAFGTKQIIGGVGGFTVIKAIQMGTKRGSFSNEAGIGSASFAAAASNSKHPISQGLMQSLSTFLDTIIICSASGFIILFSGVWSGDPSEWTQNNSGTLIQESIANNLGGTPAKWLVLICITLFGLTTTIGLYYYSETALRFLVADTYQDLKNFFKKKRSKGDALKQQNETIKSQNLHMEQKLTRGEKMAVLILQFLVAILIVICAFVDASPIWNLSDILTFVLIMINVSFMLTQIKFIIELVKDYKHQSAQNKVPTFDYLCEQQTSKNSQ